MTYLLLFGGNIIKEESLEKEVAEKGTNFSNLVRMILVEREKGKKK